MSKVFLSASAVCALIAALCWSLPSAPAGSAGIITEDVAADPEEVYGRGGLCAGAEYAGPCAAVSNTCYTAQKWIDPYGHCVGYEYIGTEFMCNEAGGLWVVEPGHWEPYCANLGEYCMADLCTGIEDNTECVETTFGSGWESCSPPAFHDCGSKPSLAKCEGMPGSPGSCTCKDHGGSNPCCEDCRTEAQGSGECNQPS